MLSLHITADTHDELLQRVADTLGMVLSPRGSVPAAVTLTVGEGGSGASGGGKTRSAKPKAETPAVPQAEAPAAPAESEAPTSEAGSGESTSGSATTASEAPPITYEEVRHAVLQLSVKRGRDAVFGVLQHFGASKTAQEIDPARWSELLLFIDDMMKD